jgi:drug/metabolite transporter (DMT)-like permease
MSFGFGIAAALASPLVMTIGFCVWQNHWKGSAFALNLYKCTLASPAFLIVVLGMAQQERNRAEEGARTELFPSDTFTRTTVGYLLLSSTIGIVIGDVLWLQALQSLGARRVIFVDSLKPFTAALLGYVLLGEEIRLTALVGIVVTVLGILLVSLEKEKVETQVDQSEGEQSNSVADETLTFGPARDASDPSSATAPTPCFQANNGGNATLWTGYAMSLANVVLDTYGAVLTKEHGKGLTTWEINLIRFGFASAVMILLSFGMTMYDVLRKYTQQIRFRTQSDGFSTPRKEIAVCDNNDVDKSNVRNDTSPGTQEQEAAIHPVCAWYSLPMHGSMTKSSWLHVSIGVALVTFLAASLSNYALFNIALALTLTLTSIGPLYALPLTYWMINAQHRQTITLRALVGTALAIAGIVVLAFWGTIPQDER